MKGLEVRAHQDGAGGLEGHVLPERARFAGELKGSMLNLSYNLTRAARHFQSKPAVFYGERVHTYAYLDERVSRLASALRDCGLQRGDRVGIVGDPEPRTLEALFGPLRAGMVIVPMNPKLHPAEHAYMLANCGAAALICGRSYLDGLLGVRDDMPPKLKILALDAGDTVAADVYDYDRALSSADASTTDAVIDAEDLAWIFYTSGTTGKPKGAMLSHRSLHTMVITQLIENNPVKPDDRFSYMTPLLRQNLNEVQAVMVRNAWLLKMIPVAVAQAAH